MGESTKISRETLQEIPLFHETGEIMISVPSLNHHTLKEIRGRFPFIEGFKKNTSPIDMVTLSLGTVICAKNKLFIPSEILKCLREQIPLGYQQAIWLEEHQDEFPKFMAMPEGIQFIDFPGTITWDNFGGTHFPCLGKTKDHKWKLFMRWIVYDYTEKFRIAVSKR